MSIQIYGYGNQASIIVITGKRHSGKSYFLKHALIPRFPYYIIWDVNHEHNPQNVKITYNLSDMATIFAQERKVVYRPLRKDLVDFEQFCNKANQFHDYMLIIEEVERYATRHYIPPKLAWIIDTGRHRGIGLTVTCRRPSDLNSRIKSNADFMFMFHQHMTRDIEYLVEWVGEGAYGLKNIETFGFMIYSDVHGEIIGKYKI